jgi:hypothetical protein
VSVVDTESNRSLQVIREDLNLSDLASSIYQSNLSQRSHTVDIASIINEK